ncbi:GntR family transcriptional regulator [Jiella marina]|uniref:GntR family transcriptional regulator n=1 Tax=Jiella sp. LLJ827 TaxID=2917712 RepID=UPI002101295A|nr:GntR family transcriptional regulator [Jiella sp. LLJ827]MCQ0986163.1 GntR family transcriptional regulator [Jiella sp. LLJ827]
MARPFNLQALEYVPAVSVTDQVFDALYDRIVELDLRPGTRLSEVEVARQMEVSRQPVRDAFYRLSQLGFLLVRPQRPTTVTAISARAVLEARFMRTAIELETVRLATERLDEAGCSTLREILDRQQAAIEADHKIEFHALDDEFHKALCEIAGAGFVWSMIRDKKAHMDRARFLSLSSGAKNALADHLRIMEALEAGNAEAARERMREHLSRIVDILEQIKIERGEDMIDES